MQRLMIKHYNQRFFSQCLSNLPFVLHKKDILSQNGTLFEVFSIIYPGKNDVLFFSHFFFMI